MKQLVLACVLSLVLSLTCSAEMILGFSGDLAPANWTLVAPTTGSANTSGAPASIQLFGSDNPEETGDGDVTSFTATIPFSGLLSFNWAFLTLDEGGAEFDPAGWYLNGSLIQLSDNAGPDSQSGIKSMLVQSGDVFGFYIDSTDGCCGASNVTISSLKLNSATVPEPATGALLGAGGILVAALRTMKRRRENRLSTN